VAEENIIEICRREAQTWIDVGIGDGWPLTQAADLIEAQQAEIERLRAERALADKLARALRSVIHDKPTAHTDEVWLRIHKALEAHEEARRG
jgi:hypothetical protein